jgi:hypothetical protein
MPHENHSVSISFSRFAAAKTNDARAVRISEESKETRIFCLMEENKISHHYPKGHNSVIIQLL